MGPNMDEDGRGNGGDTAQTRRRRRIENPLPHVGRYAYGFQIISATVLPAGMKGRTCSV